MRQRIILIAVLPLVLITVILGSYIMGSAIYDAENLLQARGESVVEFLAPACEFGVATGNVDMLRQIVSPVLATTGVKGIRIRDAEGQMLLSLDSGRAEVTERTSEKPSQIKSFSAPIVRSAPPVLDYGQDELEGRAGSAARGAETVGFVEVDFSDAELRGGLHNVIVNSAVLIGSGVLISALLGMFIGNSVARPLRNLTATVERIAQGDWHARARPSGIRELDILAAGVNSMAGTILEDRQVLESRVQQATAELRAAIEELERKNRALDAAMHEAERAGNAKSDFLARMSHEIRTPLNAIIGFSRRLSRHLVDEEQVVAVRTIDAAATQLLTIIDDILTLVRAGQTQDSLTPEPLDLREELEDILAIVASSAEDKRLELALLVDTVVPVEVTVDRIRFRQVLINLLNNAIKFTREGEVTLRARLEGSGDGGHQLVVAVVDTGAGIPEARLQNIFEPFVGSYDGGEEGQGVGLGLAISDRLVKRMGGSLSAVNRPQGGALFTVTLPVDTPVQRQPEQLLAGARIELHDPNPRVQRSLRNALVEVGAAVRVRGPETLGQVGDGAAGRDGAPELVVLGLGFDESLEGLRDRWLDAAEEMICPVLLLGHYELSSRLSGSQSLGVLDKPVNRGQLYRECLRLTGRASAGIEARECAPPEHLSLRVLVAEDNEFNRLLLETWLDGWGVETDIVADGRAALDRLLEQDFDVALLDIRMPGMDGVRVAVEARAALGDRAPYLVALTADVFFESQPERSGAFDAVLYKPIDEIRLHGILRATLDLPQVEPAPSLEDQAHERHPDLPQALQSELIAALHDGVRRLREDAQGGSRDQLADSLHACKGVAGYFGIRELDAALGDLEAELIDLDDATLAARLDRIETLVRSCCDDMRGQTRGSDTSTRRLP